jgi:hypothetical protein
MSDVIKDSQGNEVRVGDYIAFANGTYADIKVSKVVKVTPNGANVRLFGGKRPLNRQKYQFVKYVGDTTLADERDIT